MSEDKITATDTLISADIVRKITHLAKLDLTEAEMQHHCTQLDTILHFVAQLEQVDTDGIEPMYSAHALKQRVREDRVTEVDQWDDFRKIAPNIEANRFYAVPKAVHGKG